MTDTPDPADRPVLLPDGSELERWEQPLVFDRTLHVDPSHAGATDDGEGSENAPFRTINAAARAAMPGDRVLIAGGVYREWVRPARGGESPSRMISYEAAPGAQVVVKGSEVLSAQWTRCPARVGVGDPAPWMVELPRELFDGVNPFVAVNMPQLVWQTRVFDLSDELLPRLLLRRGLIFQDGRRLRQVVSYPDLAERDGTYWVDSGGLVVHARLFGDADPAKATIEITAREQIFAPELQELGYIRVKGITFEHAADGFPVPQRAAVSASRGHHWIIEGCTVRQANALGIDVGKSTWNMREPATPGWQVVRGNTVQDCGVCGICGCGPLHHSLIEDNLIERCCWQDVEMYFECAGIKTHQNMDTVIRRNLIRDIRGGSGIWMDWNNVNSRCTENVLIDVESRLGGIFVEASHEPNTVDHNIVIGMRGRAIYEHDTDRLLVAHNLVAGSDDSAIYLALGDRERWVKGRGSTARDHHVTANLIVDCPRWIEVANPHQRIDGNAYAGQCQPGPLRIHEPAENLHLQAWRDFHGWDARGDCVAVRCSLDRDSLELTVTVDGELPRLKPVPTCMTGLDGAVRKPEGNPPGPWARLVGGEQVLTIDPRHPIGD